MQTIGDRVKLVNWNCSEQLARRTVSRQTVKFIYYYIIIKFECREWSVSVLTWLCNGQIANSSIIWNLVLIPDTEQICSKLFEVRIEDSSMKSNFSAMHYSAIHFATRHLGAKHLAAMHLGCYTVNRLLCNQNEKSGQHSLEVFIGRRCSVAAIGDSVEL